MSMVSMKVGSSVSVTDGISTLWTCEGCLEVVPPPMVSSTGYFQVNYFTSSSGASYINSEGDASVYKGFEAKYFANFQEGRGLGDGQVSQLNPSKACEDWMSW